MLMIEHETKLLEILSNINYNNNNNMDKLNKTLSQINKNLDRIANELERKN